QVVHADGRPRTSATVGTDPVALATDSNGHLWVADRGSGDVRVLDPGSGRQLALITVGAQPSAIAIGSEDAFVVDHGSGDLRRIGLDSLKPDGNPLRPPGKGPASVAVDAKGRVWVGSDSSEVTIVTRNRPGTPTYIGGGGVISLATVADVGGWAGTTKSSLAELDQSGRLVGRRRPLHSGPVHLAATQGTIW